MKDEPDSHFVSSTDQLSKLVFFIFFKLFFKIIFALLLFFGLFFVSKFFPLKTDYERFDLSTSDTAQLESGETDAFAPSITGFKLLINQFYATILKKLYMYIHGWRSVLLMFIYPFGWMIISLIAKVNINILSKAKNSLGITLDLYKSLTILIQSDESNASIVSQYEKIVENFPTVHLNDSLQSYLLENKPNSVISASITKQNMTAYFDNEAYHAAPLTINVLFNAILRSFCESCSLAVQNYPVMQQKGNTPDNQNPDIGDVQFPITLGMILAIFIPMFIVHYVKERTSRAKLLQIVSGIDIFVFWSASFLWDMIVFLVFVALYFIGIVASKVEFWSEGATLVNLFILLIIFGFSVLPVVYVASFLFRVPSTGITGLLFTFMFAGK